MNGLIELMRFFASLIVVLRHGNTLTPNGMTKLFQRGGLAVEFFFIVSGYFMAKSAMKDSNDDSKTLGDKTQNFIKRKYMHLMPSFLFAWIISFVCYIVINKKFKILDFLKAAYIYICQLVPISMFGIVRDGEFQMGSWYISAMLIAMFVLYPLCVKKFDSFTKITAPVLSLFILGFISMNYKTTLSPTEVVGTVIYRGLLRAIAEISLGVAMYPLISKFKEKVLTKTQKTCVSISMIAISFAIILHTTIGTKNTFNTAFSTYSTIKLFNNYNSLYSYL